MPPHPHGQSLLTAGVRSHGSQTQREGPEKAHHGQGWGWETTLRLRGWGAGRDSPGRSRAWELVASEPARLKAKRTRALGLQGQDRGVALALP